MSALVKVTTLVSGYSFDPVEAEIRLIGTGHSRTQALADLAERMEVEAKAIRKQLMEELL